MHKDSKRTKRTPKERKGRKGRKGHVKDKKDTKDHTQRTHKGTHKGRSKFGKDQLQPRDNAFIITTRLD